MSHRIDPTKSRYYYNEHKSFPIEKLIIPVIIVAALIGGWHAYKLMAYTRGPAAAADKIMAAFKAQDVSEFGSWIHVTDEQDRRLEYGGGLDVYAREIFNEWDLSKVKVISYKVKEDVPVKDETATVPITVTVKGKTGQTMTKTVNLKMAYFGGKWRFYTDDFREMVGLQRLNR